MRRTAYIRAERAHAGPTVQAHRAELLAFVTADPILIVGAGPTGLGAAWRLQQLSADRPVRYRLIEGSDSPGGSSRSVTTPEGFTFDHGGHVLYPHAQYRPFLDLLDDVPLEWHRSVPVRGVLRGRTLVPYPVQLNIHRLPVAERGGALIGLIGASFAGRRRRAIPADETLAAYLDRRFGRGLARGVLGTINRKMWAHEPGELGSYWTAQRSGSNVANVAEVTVRDALRAMIGRTDRLGWTGKAPLRYPKTGGTGAIWTALARQFPAESMVFGKPVARIDAGSRRVELASGEAIRYSALLSTMPLDTLCRMVSPALGDAARGLAFANASFLGLGIEGPLPDRLQQVHSFHTPDPDLPCWRVSVPSNLSPGNAAGPSTWSVLCEISHRDGLGYDLDRALSAVKDAFGRREMLGPRNRIVSTWRHTILHGYPVPSIGRDDVLHDLQGRLERDGILSRGRFGGWKYEVSNMDHSFMQGVEAADRLIGRTEEATYWRPDQINQSR